MNRNEVNKLFSNYRLAVARAWMQKLHQDILKDVDTVSCHICSGQAHDFGDEICCENCGTIEA